MSCTHHPATSYRRLTTEHKPALSDKDQRRQSDEQAKAKSLRDQQVQQLRVDQQKAGGSEASIQQRGRNVLRATLIKPLFLTNSDDGFAAT